MWNNCSKVETRGRKCVLGGGTGYKNMTVYERNEYARCKYKSKFSVADQNAIDRILNKHVNIIKFLEQCNFDELCTIYKNEVSY